MKTTISKLFSISVLASLLILVSCNKDDDNEGNTPPPAPNKTQLLTSKNWSPTSITVNPSILMPQTGTPETNLTPFFESCRMDDFFDFLSNGRYTEEEGPSKCLANDPQVIDTGGWSWNSDQTLLVMVSDNQVTTEARIESISQTELVMKTTIVDNNVTYQFTTTFN